MTVHEITILVTVDEERDDIQGDELELVRDHLAEAFEQPVVSTIAHTCGMRGPTGFCLAGVTVEVLP